VRRICPHCKKEKEVTNEERSIIEAMMTDIWMNIKQAQNIKLYEWVGCEKCNNSGYLWRLWIYEIVSLDEQLRNLIREWASVDNIIREARKGDLITMKEDWILKAMGWYTTIEEILRVF
jgi:type II secretory ATPase GspE/PulE/Tfp pilus assembly ATPase PilB-like protein